MSETTIEKRAGPDESPLVDTDKAEDLFESKSGPFAPELRVACPIKGFGQRRTTVCHECPHFVGLGTRQVIFEMDDKDPVKAAQLYTIWCGFPTARSVRYFPED